MDAAQAYSGCKWLQRLVSRSVSQRWDLALPAHALANSRAGELGIPSFFMTLLSDTIASHRRFRHPFFAAELGTQAPHPSPAQLSQHAHEVIGRNLMASVCSLHKLQSVRCIVTPPPCGVASQAITPEHAQARHGGCSIHDAGADRSCRRGRCRCGGRPWVSDQCSTACDLRMAQLCGRRYPGRHAGRQAGHRHEDNAQRRARYHTRQRVRLAARPSLLLAPCVPSMVHWQLLPECTLCAFRHGLDL